MGNETAFSSPGEILWAWAVETLKLWAGLVPAAIGLTGEQADLLSRTWSFSAPLPSPLNKTELEPLPFPARPLASVFQLFPPIKEKSSAAAFQQSLEGSCNSYPPLPLSDLPPAAQESTASSLPSYPEEWRESFTRDLALLGTAPRLWWQNRFLVQKYGSFIPSGNSGLTVHWPFFVLVKVLVAAAACFEKSPKDSREPFLFIEGDLSGIQEFLLSGQSKRLLRMARARSFYLELLLRHVGMNLLGLAGLRDSSSILRCGGGILLLMVPRIPENSLTRFRDEMETWLLKAPHGPQGKIYMALAWACSESPQIPHEALHRGVELLKRRKFLRAAPFEPVNPQGGEECKVCLVHRKVAGGICPFCGSLVKVAARVGQPLASIESEILAGQETGQQKNEQHRVVLPYFGSEAAGDSLMAYRFYNEAPVAGVLSPPISTSPFFRYNVNALDASAYADGEAPVELLFLEQSSILVRHVMKRRALGRQCEEMVERLRFEGYFEGNETTEERLLVSSDILAQLAWGNPKNAVVKMDVDDLGYLQALARQRKDRHLMEEVALSYGLELFFKHYLNALCGGAKSPDSDPCSAGAQTSNAVSSEPGKPGCGETRTDEYYRLLRRGKREWEASVGIDPRRPRVNLVYAGGDDTLLFGAWDDVLEVAYAIREAFKAYTGHAFPFWSISAGMTVQPTPTSPFRKTVEEGTRALALAKKPLTRTCTECLAHHSRDCRLRGGAGACGTKDAVCLFYTPYLDRFGSLLAEHYEKQPREQERPGLGFDRISHSVPWQKRAEDPATAMDAMDFRQLAHSIVDLASGQPRSPVAADILHDVLPILLYRFRLDDPTYAIAAGLFLKRYQERFPGGWRGKVCREFCAVLKTVLLAEQREGFRTLGRFHMVVEWWQQLLRKVS